MRPAALHAPNGSALSRANRTQKSSKLRLARRGWRRLQRRVRRRSPPRAIRQASAGSEAIRSGHFSQLRGSDDILAWRLLLAPVRLPLEDRRRQRIRPNEDPPASPGWSFHETQQRPLERRRTAREQLQAERALHTGEGHRLRPIARLPRLLFSPAQDRR